MNENNLISGLIGFIITIALIISIGYSQSINSPSEQQLQLSEKTRQYSFNYYFENKDSFLKFKEEQVIKAFAIISKSTNNHFIFNEVNNISEADFVFIYLPNQIVEYKDGAGWETLGTSYVLGKEYYPYHYENQDNITLITPGNSCHNYPQIEIHEILHGLGLDHVDNNKSIMYPYFTCATLENDSDSINQLYQLWGISP